MLSRFFNRMDEDTLRQFDGIMRQLRKKYIPSTLEQMEDSRYKEPSLDEADHYNHYEEVVRLLAGAGLNTYRFSIEWARIEPEPGVYDDTEIEHYRRVLECCRANGITPIVTVHHFASSKWLISQGGWEDERTVEAFASYCRYVADALVIAG